MSKTKTPAATARQIALQHPERLADPVTVMTHPFFQELLDGLRREQALDLQAQVRRYERLRAAVSPERRDDLLQFSDAHDTDCCVHFEAGFLVALEIGRRLGSTGAADPAAVGRSRAVLDAG